MNSDEVTYGKIDTLLQEAGRLVVCTVIRSQGSVPRRTGARMVVLPNGERYGTVGGGLFEALAQDEALAVLATGKSGSKTYDFRETGASPDAFGAVCGGTAELFFEVATLPERLLIVGGGHCGRALARAAALLSRFEVVLADARLLPEGEEEPLPSSVMQIQLQSDYSDLAARADATTFVALVSQGAETDERALREVIAGPARYIGMMGSRKKVRTVFDHLRRDGVTDAQLACVSAPIGLEIGAETPAEIAVSILAQIIAARNGAAAAVTKETT